MTTIITRSALVHWGHNPPPDVASVEIDYRGRHVVTWAEVMENRRKRQAEILRYKRHATEWKPYKVWVAYYDQDLMGGWQSFIENRDGCHWIDRDRCWLMPHLMELFPLTLPLGDARDGWGRWKQAFAQQYRRGTHHRRARGVAIVWWTGNSDRPRLTPPWQPGK